MDLVIYQAVRQPKSFISLDGPITFCRNPTTFCTEENFLPAGRRGTYPFGRQSLLSPQAGLNALTTAVNPGNHALPADVPEARFKVAYPAAKALQKETGSRLFRGMIFRKKELVM